MESPRRYEMREGEGVAYRLAQTALEFLTMLPLDLSWPGVVRRVRTEANILRETDSLYARLLYEFATIVAEFTALPDADFDQLLRERGYSIARVDCSSVIQEALLQLTRNKLDERFNQQR